MTEYLVLLFTFPSPEGRMGEFLGKKNKRKCAPLTNLRPLFESYSKNTVMMGWKKQKDAKIHYSLAKLRFPEAELISVDIFENPAIMEIL